jgi:hypothetical protein
VTLYPVVLLCAGLRLRSLRALRGIRMSPLSSAAKWAATTRDVHGQIQSSHPRLLFPFRNGCMSFIRICFCSSLRYFVKEIVRALQMLISIMKTCDWDAQTSRHFEALVSSNVLGEGARQQNPRLLMRLCATSAWKGRGKGKPVPWRRSQFFSFQNIAQRREKQAKTHRLP